MKRLLLLIFLALGTVSVYAQNGTVVGTAGRAHGVGNPNLNPKQAFQNPDWRLNPTEYVDTITKEVWRFVGVTANPKWVADPIGGSSGTSNTVWQGVTFVTGTNTCWTTASPSSISNILFFRNGVSYRVGPIGDPEANVVYSSISNTFILSRNIAPQEQIKISYR